MLIQFLDEMTPGKKRQRQQPFFIIIILGFDQSEASFAWSSNKQFTPDPCRTAWVLHHKPTPVHVWSAINELSSIKTL